MGKGINGDPNDYSFGRDFNYAVWGKDTIVTLSNVTWDSTYEKTVRFNNRSELNAYIDSNSATNISLSKLSYVKPNTPVRIPTTFNIASRYNYLRVTNPLQPVGADTRKEYYYFILDVRYVAPNTTEIVVQLDVWATYINDIELGQCFLERGHMGIAAVNNFDVQGLWYLDTDEGLDLGSEYVVRHTHREKLVGPATGDHTIIALSSINLSANPGTAEAPNLVTATGSDLQGLPSAGTYYVWEKIADFQQFLMAYEDKPWVTQGIMAAAIIPDIKRIVPWFTWDDKSTRYYGKKAPDGLVEVYPLRKSAMTGWRYDNDLIAKILPEPYRKLRKFFTYPYMVIEITTYTGTPIFIKPQYWQTNSMEWVERYSLHFPNQRAQLSPLFYNGPAATSIRNPDDPFDPLGSDGDSWDNFTQINEFPRISILNNQAILALANTAHSRYAELEGAKWTQQRALQSAATSYDQASASMNLANTISETGLAAEASQTALTNRYMQDRSLLDGIVGIGQGVMSGGIGGPAGMAVGGAAGIGNAVLGGIQTNMAVSQNNESLAISQNAKRSIANAQSNHAGLIRDSNRSLAEWGAKGDYEHTIAAINARVQDTKMSPPSVSGQTGGDILSFVNRSMGCFFKIKTLHPRIMHAVGDYWLRYGYALGLFLKPPTNLKCMDKFTYWKFKGVTFAKAPIPEGHRQVIKGIFEKGVTIFSNPNDIPTMNIYTNQPIPGISLPSEGFPV